MGVCLRGLGPQYKAFKTSIQTRENIPNFADLVSMLIIEEKTLGEDQSSQSKNSFEQQQVFYSNAGRGRAEAKVEAKQVAEQEIRVLDIVAAAATVL